MSYESKVYFTLYFYNAVIEYVYFVIIHIQNSGSKHVSEIEKHLKFFKTEAVTFIRSFSGTNMIEKCTNMLCTATPVFYSTNGMLSLSDNFMYFKQIIYEDLIISRSVDLVLRGVNKIEEMCDNLNANNVIKVNKNTLTTLLKLYPYFFVDTNESVIVLQYHGLLGFHNYTYEKVVQYFLSVIQNSCFMIYEHIKLHSQFVPACGIRSGLATFCIINSCDIFKCRSSRVFLRKRGGKIHSPCQQLNIKSDVIIHSPSITLLVHQAFGKKLYNWTGEVAYLMKNGGLINCVIDFKDYVQDLFIVYFHKSALKYVSEIQNLSSYISVKDTVKFDAKFRIGYSGRYWHASKVTLVQSTFKQNLSKCIIEPEKYMESVSPLCHFNPALRSILHAMCPFNFNKLKLPSIVSENSIFKNYGDFIKFLEDCFNFSDFEFKQNKQKPLFQETINLKDIFQEESFMCNSTSSRLENFFPAKLALADSIEKGKHALHNESSEIPSKFFENKCFFSKMKKYDLCEYKTKDRVQTQITSNCIEINCDSKTSNDYTADLTLNSQKIIVNKNQNCRHINSMCDPRHDPGNTEVRLVTPVIIDNCELPKLGNSQSNIISQDVYEPKYSVNLIESSELSCKKKRCQIEMYCSCNVSLNTDLLNHSENNVSKPTKSLSIPQEIKIPSDSILNESCKNNVTYTVTNNYQTHNNQKRQKNSIENFMIPQYLLLFGEIETITNNGGIICCSNGMDSYYVYFQNESLFYSDFSGHQQLFKHDRTLVIVPNIDETTYPVAMLVYLLCSEENYLVQKENICANDFVLKYFLPKIERKYSDLLCCCNLNVLMFDMPFEFKSNKNKEIKLRCLNFTKSLKEMYMFDMKTLQNLLSLIVGIQKTSAIIQMPKSCFYVFYLLPFIFGVKNQKSFKHRKRCKNVYNRINNQLKRSKYQSLPNPARIMCSSNTSCLKEKSTSLYSCSLNNLELVHKDQIISKSKSESNLMPKMQQKDIHIPKVSYYSSSSLESYVSCKSSSDTYYSCKSSVDISNLNSGNTCENVIVQTGSLPTLISTNHADSSDSFIFKSLSNVNLCSNAKKPAVSNSNGLIHINFTENKTSKGSYTIAKQFKDKRLSHKNSLKFKIRRWKMKLLILTPSKFCRQCIEQSIETIANICMITSSCIFLNLRDNSKCNLYFPLKLVPEVLKSNLKLNSTVKITYIPNVPINLSHVLLLEIPDY